MGWILQIKRVFLCAERRPETSYTVGSAYTEEELANKIRPLAEAGNESKCRFVYALHPFPQGNHLRFDDNYEADLAKLQAKFKQGDRSGRTSESQSLQTTFGIRADRMEYVC